MSSWVLDQEWLLNLAIFYPPPSIYLVKSFNDMLCSELLKSSQIFLKSIKYFFHALWWTILNLEPILGQQMPMQPKYEQIFK